MPKKPDHRPIQRRIRAWRPPEAGAFDRTYDREHDLTRLLPVPTALLSGAAAQPSRDMLAFLRRALRVERIRGIAGHWTYDLGRHAALLAAYRAELSACSSLRGAPNMPRRDEPPLRCRNNGRQRNPQ